MATTCTGHEQRIEERIKLCKIERRSYEIWLNALTPANFLLVGVGGVLSLVAGLSIVSEAKLVEPYVAGWVVVVGALLTGLHNRLKCEPHQAECKKLGNQFAELQTDYERLELESDDQTRKEQLMSLEQKLAAIRAGRGASAAEYCVNRARIEIEAQT